MVNPGKSNNNNGALDLPLPAQYIAVALERNFISTDPTSHITWEVFASNFNMNFLVSIQLVEAFSPKNAINSKKLSDLQSGYFLVLKIPSEMEVAPRYNCWHCSHWWVIISYMFVLFQFSNGKDQLRAEMPFGKWLSHGCLGVFSNWLSHAGV